MAQKHLKELLKEDQEPFQLKDYIAERQCLLKKQPQRTQIQLKKPKPMSKSKTFSCKNACFFSLQDSPDLRKSPLFEFRSPCKSPNRVFLQVPARTATLLLEAALRIQKPKTQIKNTGFGLFGSMLKRLTHRSRAQKLKGSETEVNRTRENRTVIFVGVNDKEAIVSSSSSSSSSSSCYSYSCNGRQSSLDSESSSSGRSFEEEEKNEDGFEFANLVRENGDCLSPFRFVLRGSPNLSPDCRSPVFSSPARHRTLTQDKEMEYERQSPLKLEEEEEDKEQNSPVSVLDPPFEDDDYDDYSLQSTFTFVQRAKQQLLHKLRRFEKLAELDPIELEKLIEEEEEDDENDNGKEEINGGQGNEQEYDNGCLMYEEQRQVDELIDNVAMKIRVKDMKKRGFRRLICDLIMEEKSSELEDRDDEIIKRVCKRLELWKEVESNTIDMMVAMDLRRENSNWKNAHYACHDRIGEATIHIEVAIFAILVQELVQDISNSS